MNQKYIEYVKTAHKLCKEMSELDSKSSEFANKAEDYIKFVLECDDGNWRIPVYILRIALVEYNLAFDARREQSFDVFTYKYKELLMGPSLKTDSEKKYFLSEDLLYLRDIQGQ